MSMPESCRNILVVEDDWLIALDIEMLIEEEDHRVIGPAKNVAMALSLIQAHQIDAAFLDITLGSENSFPIARRLREKSIPFTFVSAYAPKDIPAEFRAFDLLAKPLVSRLFQSQLGRMLGER